MAIKNKYSEQLFACVLCDTRIFFGIEKDDKAICYNCVNEIKNTHIDLRK